MEGETETGVTITALMCPNWAQSQLAAGGPAQRQVAPLVPQAGQLARHQDKMPNSHDESL